MTESLATLPRPTLDDLADRLAAAKSAENAARDHRIAIEEQIIAAMGVKDEGSFSLEGSRYKVTTTGKLTRTVDDDTLEAIADQIPVAIWNRLVSYTPKLNLKELRYVEQNEPELFAILAKAITTKPAKPSVAIKEL